MDFPAAPSPAAALSSDPKTRDTAFKAANCYIAHFPVLTKPRVTTVGSAIYYLRQFFDNNKGFYFSLQLVMCNENHPSKSMTKFFGTMFPDLPNEEYDELQHVTGLYEISREFLQQAGY